MDRRERFDDPEEALRVAMEGNQAAMWTAIPGIVQSYDAAAVTVSVQPAIKGIVQGADGNFQASNMPILPDVPVVFPRGGGCTLTFPIAAGDECLVVFSSRCIDMWWQNGGVQMPFEQRMHDLSDGFAIMGPQSQKNKITNISNTAVQLRSNDGIAVIQLNPTTHAIDVVTTGAVTVSTTTDIILNAPSVTINGNVTVNGRVDASGDVTGQGTSLHHHTHGGVKAGAESTAEPN